MNILHDVWPKKSILFLQVTALFSYGWVGWEMSWMGNGW